MARHGYDHGHATCCRRLALRDNRIRWMQVEHSWSRVTGAVRCIQPTNGAPRRFMSWSAGSVVGNGRRCHCRVHRDASGSRKTATARRWTWPRWTWPSPSLGAPHGRMDVTLLCVHAVCHAASESKCRTVYLALYTVVLQRDCCAGSCLCTAINEHIQRGCPAHNMTAVCRDTRRDGIIQWCYGHANGVECACVTSVCVPVVIGTWNRGDLRQVVIHAAPHAYNITTASSTCCAASPCRVPFALKHHARRDSPPADANASVCACVCVCV